MINRSYLHSRRLRLPAAPVIHIFGDETLVTALPWEECLLDPAVVIRDLMCLNASLETPVAFS